MHKRIVTHLLRAGTSILALVSICCVSGCAPSSPPAHTSNTTQVQPGVTASPQTLTTTPDLAPKTSGGPDDAGNDQGSDGVGVKAVNPPPARPPIRRAGSGDIVDITFDDLKLEMPVGTLFDKKLLTPRIEELDGQNVRLRGFIFAGGVFQSTGIRSFPFVMNTQCKFGPQGLAYCVILVELVDGVTTDFTTYPITVEGKLSVQPFNANGFTWSVYHMRGTKAD